ncbi:uncharacterized protein B0T15DRAFT_388170 [Chaetomium strumarium]|uniref:Uncharacterized protein n=1 Tax=Chaetomium strumarium TaxID=1170767 RepID=A0AAJ0H0U5_9PEZI|nr:hypothetical protein B0T15DRAFT_388170 [Chaetomium strumarium]
MQPPTVAPTVQAVQPDQGDEEALLNDSELETTDSDPIHISDSPQPTQACQSTDTLADSPPEEEEAPTPPPLMHFPHCRLDITTITASDLPASFERVALPGSLVRTLLSRFEDEIVQTTTTTQAREQPQPQQKSQQQQLLQPRLTVNGGSGGGSGGGRKEAVQIQRHFDDDDEWVYSRCLLADYTNFREDEAEALSEHSRLCCWASVLLRPLPLEPGAAEGEGEGEGGSSSGGGSSGGWELEFIVLRVGVRDPESGWCECF